jgi:hypothetical protein
LPFMIASAIVRAHTHAYRHGPSFLQSIGFAPMHSQLRRAV